MIHADVVPEFAFSTFKLQFMTVSTTFLPLYCGSTFHGAFGRALYRTECKRPNNDCRDCYLKNECLYWRYFLRTNQGDRHPPRPYVIEAPPGEPNGLQPGQPMTVVFTWIGESLDHLPALFAAFEAMGRQGFGKGRKNGLGRCSLAAIYNLNGHLEVPVYPAQPGQPCPPTPVKRRWSEFVQTAGQPVDRVGIRFLTPTRIQHQGKLMDRVPFSVLVSRLLNRLTDLDREYCGNSLQIPAGDLIALAEREVAIADAKERTHWQDWERYSERQKTRMKLGGVVGEIVYQGNLGPFIPYLYLAEYLHVGKQATFGNGVVRIKVL